MTCVKERGGRRKWRHSASAETRLGWRFFSHLGDHHFARLLLPRAQFVAQPLQLLQVRLIALTFGLELRQ